MDHGDDRKTGLGMEDSVRNDDDCGVTYDDFRRFYGTEGHFLVREAASCHVDHIPRDNIQWAPMNST